MWFDLYFFFLASELSKDWNDVDGVSELNAGPEPEYSPSKLSKRRHK